MMQEEMAFNRFFLACRADMYVCLSVLLQWGRMRAWEIERAAMLAQVKQTRVEA